MKPLKLTVAGCGDAFGSGGRLHTCFHVETGHSTFLIDCGASSLPGLKQNNLNPEDIDTIFLTHFHGDHFGGIPFLLMQASVDKRKKPLTIASPPGGKQKISDLLRLLYPGNSALESLNIRFIEYQPFETLVIGDIGMRAFPVIHSKAAFPHGLRFSVSGKTISYSGDTEWTENLIPLAENADLFICECNFYQTEVKGHLNYQALKSKLKLLKYYRIILTHLDTEMLKAMDNVELECANDGMEIIV
jgi:ribonuclease BN (tRNA processing enzyme)